MKKIDTQGPIGDEFVSWHQEAQTARDQMIRKYLSTGDISEPNSEILRDLKEKFLIKVFHSKCAYCESNIPIENFPGFVDHYRPRKAVTVNRKRIDHPGYFWLTYEWDNLLPVCHNCNSGHGEFSDDERVSHPGKSMEFPIRGERVMAPSENQNTWAEDLKKELPLILNPYYDEPKDHIAFDDLGFLYSKNCSERGKTTIETCHLNRLNLCEKRRNFANEIFRKRLHHLIEVPGTKVCQADDDFSAWLNHALPTLIKRFFEDGGIKIEGDILVEIG